MRSVCLAFLVSVLVAATAWPAPEPEQEADPGTEPAPALSLPIQKDIEDAPLLAEPEAAAALQSGARVRPTLLGTLNDQHLLLVGLRMDTAYSAGGAIAQGFSIPSVRLTAWGNAGDLISYRFSLGQTREFSSVMLPQVMPVEAFVDFNSSSALDWEPSSRLTLRLGLFTPTFNPWWSPDLADIALPDYHETHRRLFINRDIGAELLFEPIAERLKFYVGLFNGSGIFSLNTNNARALTGGLQGVFHLGNWHLLLGASGAFREQSDPASVNFRSDMVANAFVSLHKPGSAFRLTGELFAGELNDSSGTFLPRGFAGTLQLPVLRGVHFFSRIEAMEDSGFGDGIVHNAQAGPVFVFTAAAHAYLCYQYQDLGGSVENQGWFRLRLNL